MVLEFRVDPLEVGLDTADGSVPLASSVPDPLVPDPPPVPLTDRDTAGEGVAVGTVDRPLPEGKGEDCTWDWPEERAASTAGSTEDTSALLAAGPASELCGAGPMAAPSAMPTANSTAASAPLTLAEGSRGPDFGGGGGEEGRGSLMAWPPVGTGA